MNRLLILPAILAFLLNCTDTTEIPVTSEIPPEDITFTRMSASTSVIATIDRCFSPLMDGNIMYYIKNVYDSIEQAHLYRVIRLDRTTGVAEIMNKNPSDPINWLAQDDEYLYFSYLSSKTIYRMLKDGDGTIESYVSFVASDYTPKILRVDGNDLFMTDREKPGLFHYNREDDAFEQLYDQDVSWFDIDEDYIFWTTLRDETTGNRLIIQMSRTGGAQYERANADLWHFKQIGHYIYYVDEHADEILMRLDKRNRNPASVVSYAFNNFTEDDAFTVVNNGIYVTNYKGELWQVPADTTDSPVLLDKWGTYDDDDFNPWVGSDGSVLYWIAGPDPDVRISDNDEGALLKSVLSDLE